MATTRRRSTSQREGDSDEETLPQVTPSEQPPVALWKRIAAACFVVTIVLCSCVIYVKFFRDIDIFVPAQMTKNMPTTNCRPVSKDDIASLEYDPNWKHTVRSMYWHMKNGDLEAISAFHMGDPTCFVLVRRNDSEDILPMFNVAFRGYSPNSIVARNEESLACPGVIRNMVRATHVRVTYIDGTTHRDMIELFTGPEAFALQHVVFYSQGRSICELYATNADKGVTTLRELIVADTYH